MKLPDTPRFLLGIGGSPEIGRVMLTAGTFFAVVTPVVFEAYEIGWNGGRFNVTEWCLAYPGGLLALVGGGVFAIGNKDRQVATARHTLATASTIPGATP